MGFLFGVLIGAIMAIVLFSSSGLTGEHKHVILRSVSMLDRYVDFVESEARAGRIEYEGTRLHEDYERLEKDVEALNAKLTTDNTEESGCEPAAKT